MNKVGFKCQLQRLGIGKNNCMFCRVYFKKKKRSQDCISIRFQIKIKPQNLVFPSQGPSNCSVFSAMLLKCFAEEKYHL